MIKRCCSFLLVLTLTLTLFAGIPVEVQAALNDDITNCVAYNQYVEPWTSQVYGGGTIGQTGCGILSTTNALNYMYDVFNTTDKANAFIKEWATYAHSIDGYNPGTEASGGWRYVLFGNEISDPPPLITKYGSKYNISMPIVWTEEWNYANSYNGYSYNNIYVNSQTDLKNYLSRGSVAIAHVPGHFICLAAYNPANDHFLVLDSAPTTARGTGDGVAWVSASDLSGGRPALTVGGFCVINTTLRRNTSPYQLDDTTMMIYDGESFPTMKTAFSTSLMPSKNHTQGLRSLKMMYTNPTGYTNKAGGYTYITLDSVTDFTDYDLIAFDLYVEKTLTGSHGFQLNFCVSGEDGYNAMKGINNLEPGWHSFTLKRSDIGKAVDSADWTKVKYIRLMWWNNAQLSGTTYFLIDNFRAINTDLSKAKEVMAKINALPATITLADKDAVTAARTAYDALTDKGKGYVTNLATLETAEATIQAIEQDMAAAASVDAMIEALPTEVALTDEEAIVSARTAYEELTDAQKGYVENLSVLETAEEALEAVKAQDLADRQAAAEVDEMILALPEEITLDCEEQLTIVVDTYNGLTNTAKGYVTNLPALVEAVDIWNALNEQDKLDRAAAGEVDALIAALPAVEELTLDHQTAVEEAVAAYDALNDAAKGYVTAYETLQAAVAQMNELKFVYGDVNHDFVIDNKDFGLLQRYLNGWDVEIRLDAADVNVDGEIDNKDFAVLQRYLNGWDISLGPVETVDAAV